MVDNIRGTVNLRKNQKKIKSKKRPVDLSTSVSEREATIKKNKEPQKKIEEMKKEKANDIDEVYTQEEESGRNRDFKTIDRPAAKKEIDSFYKKITFLLLLVLICVLSYFLFFAGKESIINEEDAVSDESWYAVKLVTGDIYYGKVGDIEADPLVLKNVYYDYDQLKKDGEGNQSESSSMRLVKRGKEAYGPDGTMNIVRSQVLFIEPLKDESKVLRAILEYEK